jgi:hypothetical protein
LLAASSACTLVAGHVRLSAIDALDCCTIATNSVEPFFNPLKHWEWQTLKSLLSETKETT